METVPEDQNADPKKGSTKPETEETKNPDGTDADGKDTGGDGTDPEVKPVV